MNMMFLYPDPSTYRYAKSPRSCSDGKVSQIVLAFGVLVVCLVVVACGGVICVAVALVLRRVYEKYSR